MKKNSQEEIEGLFTCNMRVIDPLGKEMKADRSHFYEILVEVIEGNLKMYNPSPNIFPLPERDDLEVDYLFDIKPYPIFSG